MNQYLTTVEAATYLGVSRQRLYQMIAKTSIRPVAWVMRAKGRPALWAKTDIDKLAAIRLANIEQMLDRVNGGNDG